MSFSRGIQTPSSFLPGSLALPPCTLIMGTTALPFRLVVTVAASITDPHVIVGTKTPSSPSGAAIATSTGVTALRVSFARLNSRTAATVAPLPPVSVRKGITTCCCFSSYRTSFFSKSITALWCWRKSTPMRNSSVHPSMMHASTVTTCPYAFRIWNVHTPMTSSTNPPMPSTTSTGGGRRARSPRSIQSVPATEYLAPLSNFTGSCSPSTSMVAVGNPSSASTHASSSSTASPSVVARSWTSRTLATSPSSGCRTPPCC
ncbi:hypothetical protein PF001_g28160 [Phytophthora fragariae]|uniref:Uncharacterized protein n=2 Tax=Phytophthora fragariae TaxID=53985 RepID=A0A6A4BAS9_9STRA|nr:hypothetical protein PF001_g28160 [Phytophthora fragariae]